MNKVVGNVLPNRVRKLKRSACHVCLDHMLYIETSNFSLFVLHHHHQQRLMLKLQPPPMTTQLRQLRMEALTPSLGQQKTRKVTH